MFCLSLYLYIGCFLVVFVYNSHFVYVQQVCSGPFHMQLRCLEGETRIHQRGETQNTSRKVQFHPFQ